jgi:hypothetical protein
MPGIVAQAVSFDERQGVSIEVEADRTKLYIKGLTVVSTFQASQNTPACRVTKDPEAASAIAVQGTEELDLPTLESDIFNTLLEK